jgi:hypothetical protein
MVWESIWERGNFLSGEGKPFGREEGTEVFGEE